jgi:1,4-dihydroxy-2-naphthoyl-CoA hydrolase
LRLTAKPLTRGRRTQIWEAVVHDDVDRALATGRVRLLCVEQGTEVAGKRIEPIMI